MRRFGAAWIKDDGFWPWVIEARSLELGIDAIGADQALGKFIVDALIFRQQLAGDVKLHAIASMLTNNVGKFLRDEIQRCCPVGACARRIALRAQLRIQRAPLNLCREALRRALGAKPAKIRRRGRIATHTADALAVARDRHTAANIAVRAG